MGLKRIFSGLLGIIVLFTAFSSRAITGTSVVDFLLSHVRPSADRALAEDNPSSSQSGISHEVDALKYGDGTFTDATLTEALAKVGTTDKVTLVLSSGTWIISETADYSAYSNVNFKMEYGACFSPSSAQMLTLPSPANIMAQSNQQIFTGAGNVKFALPGIIYPDWWGAKADFDPATGTGTDSRKAIQAAFDSACLIHGGATISFPAGRYYCGGGAGRYAGGTQIVLGSITPDSAKNISIIGDGAELYQGAGGRLLGIFGANGVRVSGLKVLGFAGGTPGPKRESDALITINYNSKNVVVENNYLTNTLGDCIYIGGSLKSGGELGYESRNITLRNNTLKERYGNGVRSYKSGTRSRLAVAVIDCVGLSIHDNIIYGAVDLEPNLKNQHIVNVTISNNKFLSGSVTAQDVIGSDYWYDEPINFSGGSVINQGVRITGVTGSPIVSSVVVKNNSFQYGSIFDHNIYKFDQVTGNFFVQGQIIVGSTSGPNHTANRYIADNHATLPMAGKTAFISLNGFVYNSTLENNKADLFAYCIDDNGASTGDGGRNKFINNSLVNGIDVLGFGIKNTSIEVGSSVNGLSRNMRD